MNNTPLLDDKLHWYKDAIIYELHIKAFCDGNGDGIGDFEGLMSKLDYLQDLGVTAIWVLPFYPSPLKDDGYDIADYYAINSSYGTIEQFKKFLEESHRRNLKVITELVINHTSDQHPWFQQARNAPKGSPERDYYVWTDNPNQYKDVRIIFQDFEASNWTWDPIAKQYYWHRFFHHQPDLNYDSLLVQHEVFKMLDYWCEMGVDGFRLDAVPYLYEREGTNGENLPETHAFLKKLRAHIDEKFPGTVFLAEANMWPEDSASYFGNGDECHMNYHFPVMPRMFMALQMEDRYPITDIFDQTPPIPPTCQWAIFLRNHDELTLEMVTDEERDYMYKVYAKDPRAKINLGIRHRLAPLMGNSRRKIELMNCLLFSLPGTPVIYYGDEIGMGDNFYLGDRDGVRTPMQWSPDRNAGFSRANPQRLYLPVIIDPEYNYEYVNVEMQRLNTSSLFWFMKRIINMRKKFKAFGRGDLKFVNTRNPKVLAFTRTYEDETLLIVVNLSKYSQAAEIDLAAYGGCTPLEVFSRNKFPVIREDRPYFFTLGSHGYEWFVLQRQATEGQHELNMPAISVTHWNELSTNELLHELENNVLPVYLLNADWFINKNKAINNINITEHTTITTGDYNTVLLLFEVQYESGLPELYQLPLTFAKGKLAQRILENNRNAIIANMKIEEEEGLLVDALYTSGLQQALLNMLIHRSRIEAKDSHIDFFTDNDTRVHLNRQQVLRTEVRTQDGFTALMFDNGFVLIMYRKVERTINPDVELTKHLSEQGFQHIAPYAGTIEWKLAGDSITLGMLQFLPEHHGDSRSFMLTRINNYIERIFSHKADELKSAQLLGTLTEPLSFEALPEQLQLLLGTTASEHAKLLGKRTGEMHLALAAEKKRKEFAPEEFSLHYQRSLFASMQSVVREAYDKGNETLATLPETLRQDMQSILKRKSDVLDVLKRIYIKKLDVVKIRMHGHYNLGKVVLTGRDIAITDFGGDPSRSFSERRLKRSPLRDVVFMIRSFYYVAYDGFLKNAHIQKEEQDGIIEFASIWAHYMSGFFIKAYFDAVQGTVVLPADKKELQMMLDTFMLNQAVHDLNYELTNRLHYVSIPLKRMKAILGLA